MNKLNTSPPIKPNQSYYDSYLLTLPSKQPKKQTHNQIQNSIEQKKQQQDAAYQSASSFAKNSISQLVTTFFMLYMTGNSLQIFPLIMLMYSASTPIRSILSLQQTFQRYDNIGITCYIPKLLYFMIHFICLCGVLWKCHKMELIPLEWFDDDIYLYSYLSPQINTNNNNSNLFTQLFSSLFSR